jgi:hypothetical protein
MYIVRFEVFTAMTMKNAFFFFFCGSCENRRVSSFRARGIHELKTLAVTSNRSGSS